MNTQNTALIVIDVQKDFLTDGALAVPDGEFVISPIIKLSRLIDTVVLTQDWHPADHKSFASNHEDAAPFTMTEMPYGPQVLWPDHCVQGRAGAELMLTEEVMNTAILTVRKGMNPEVDSYSAFMENDKETRTGLAGFLKDRKIDTVVLTGLALDYCVAYSALDAVDAGFRTIVVLEATRAIAEETKVAQIQAMQDAGVEIVETVADLRTVLGA